MSGYCKYCDRTTNKMIKKKETYIINDETHIYYWIGCQSCWDRLQKVA